MDLKKIMILCVKNSTEMEGHLLDSLFTLYFKNVITFFFPLNIFKGV